MISYSYIYRNEDVDAILERIDNNALCQSTSYNIDSKNDVALINAILYINKHYGIYRKKELNQYIWGCISGRCIVDNEFPIRKTIETYKQGFDNLFDYCWKQKISIHKDGKGAKSLNKIVYKQMPFSRKLIDSNISLFICFALFLILVYLIDKWTIEDYSWKWVVEKIDTHPIVLTLSFLF